MEEKQKIFTGVCEVNQNIYAFLKPKDLQSLRCTCTGVKTEVDTALVQYTNKKGVMVKSNTIEYIQKVSFYKKNNPPQQLRIKEEKISEVKSERHPETPCIASLAGGVNCGVVGMIGGLVALFKLGSVGACIGISAGGFAFGLVGTATGLTIRDKFCLPTEETLNEETLLLKEQIDNAPTGQLMVR